MTESAVDPGLILKITPPKLRRSLLARERLRRLAIEGQDTPVFLVEAPAGYGKTSLLAQWRLDWLQAGAAVAWMSFDSEDSPVSVVSGVILGLRRSTGKPHFGTEALEAVRHGAGPVLAITSLLAEIAEAAVPTVLIFDNCERARGQAVLEAVDYLLHNLPPNLQIVLGSRPPLPFQTIDLLGQGSLRRVGPADLRFELGEALQLLSVRLGDRVGADLCARLHEVTDGWPLGLQLAAAAIEQAADPASTIQAFSATRDDAIRRLFDGMLDVLPRATARFATCCALLDALHPSLCEAVTREEDAGLLLQRMLVETPLVTAAEGGDWMRYHPLAREYLRSRAREVLSEVERREVHDQAWQWLARHGFPARAVQHALAAGRGREAIGLIASALNDEFEAGHAGTVADWLARIPSEQIQGDVRLSIDALWLRLLSYDQGDALRECAALVDDASIDRLARVELLQVLAAGYSYRDQLDVARECSSRADPGTGDSRAWQTQANIRTALAIYAGATEEARQIQARIRRESKIPIVRIWADYFVGQSYLWEGRPLLAEEVARMQLAPWEAEVGRRGEWASMLASVLAAACWQRDLRRAAEVLLADRLDVIERSAPPDGIVGAFRALAQLECARGDEARAYSYLEALASLGAARGLARFIVVSLAERTRLHALGRRPAQAATLLAELSAVFERFPVCPTLEPLLRLEQALAHAYVTVTGGDLPEAARYLTVASTLARNLNRGYEAVQVLALQALVADRAGTAAGPVLVEALSRAEAGGLVRVFADTLPQVVELIARCARDGRHAPVSRAYMERVVAAATGPADWASQPIRPVASAGSAMLTPKEADVLRLLSGGHPNKVIAAELGLSADTIKWHIKKLFSKLNAGSREHAVERARMLGLLR